MSAASAFKRIHPDSEVTVLEKDYFISYGACSLPYYISDEVKDFNNLISLTPETATKDRGITVLLRHEAVSIDREAKEVHQRTLKKEKQGNSV
jgi:NADPH-dependent 2,4-dienoyl-CoA reductase/sulfur reductase-like enzyme